jgi:transposase-like protein
MPRKPQVQRSAEEKFAIVIEGLKSGNIAETCRTHQIAATLYYRWKEEAEKAAVAALAGSGRCPTSPRWRTN